MVSCMRFRQRTKVDFPQPEGPMTAVAWFGGTSRLMLSSAWRAPNQAFKPETWMAVPISGCSSQHASARNQSHNADGADNQDDEHQRASPGLFVPIVKGRGRVG